MSKLQPYEVFFCKKILTQMSLSENHCLVIEKFKNPNILSFLKNIVKFSVEELGSDYIRISLSKDSELDKNGMNMIKEYYLNGGHFFGYNSNQQEMCKKVVTLYINIDQIIIS